VLSITGLLNLEMRGPSVYPKIPDEVLQSASRPDAAWGQSPLADQVRRSVYVFVKRSISDPVLLAFDSADKDGSCPVRFATTVPTQALTSLNGEFYNAQAGQLARQAGVRRMVPFHFSPRYEGCTDRGQGLQVFGDMVDTSVTALCLFQVEMGDFAGHEEDVPEAVGRGWPEGDGIDLEGLGQAAGSCFSISGHIRGQYIVRAYPGHIRGQYIVIAKLYTVPSLSA
ncbi:MAG: DUF1553 domain-containing protein, partial [Lysobacterales bacterium]